MVCGIYQIRNLVSNKIYIGSSTRLYQRKSRHLYDLRRNIHPNTHLQSAYNKYGEENLVFEILITCTKSLLVWYEQQFIDQWKPEYNIRKIAESNLGITGRVCSEETKEKISQAQIGKKRNPLSEEHKLKISMAHKGKIKSLEWRTNLAKSLLGKPHTEERKAKNRISHLDRKLSKEQKMKISNSMKLFKSMQRNTALSL